MKTREEAARFAQKLLDDGLPDSRKLGAWHFGRVELRELLDFIFEGPPSNSAEKIHNEPKRKRT